MRSDDLTRYLRRLSLLSEVFDQHDVSCGRPAIDGYFAVARNCETAYKLRLEISQLFWGPPINRLTPNIKES